MNKLYRYGRYFIAAIIGILSVLAFTGLFYPLNIFDIQFSALLQRTIVDFSLVAGILFGGLLLITFLFGRIYCSTLCPLGILQEVLMLIFRRRVPLQKSRPYKYFLAAVVFGTLLGGSILLLRLIDPYTIFGSAASGIALGIGIIAVITVLVWFKGRLFCSNICPVGAVLGLISKHARNQIYIEGDKCVACSLCARNCPTGSIDFKNKTVDNETCIKCFKCLGVCRQSGLHYGSKPAQEVPFNANRRNLLVSGAVIAAFAVAVKGGIELAKTTASKIKKIILPAGGGNPADFANRCLNCNLCVENCPMKIIKKADQDFKAVHIDYKDSFCKYDCHKCSEVCPSGAIKKLTLAQKQKTQIALAVINEQDCIKCGLCVHHCPRQIIHKEDGSYPHINTDECIGCGACQSVCPVSAITVSAVNQQKVL